MSVAPSKYAHQAEQGLSESLCNVITTNCVHFFSVFLLRFFVTFKDDFSSFCEIYLLKRKSEVPEAFMKYNAKMKSETGRETKILRSDGGGEYCSKDFENWLAKAGISHQVTPPYTPQLNGVAERTNRTVIESARS